jgi:hypothetical protein
MLHCWIPVSITARSAPCTAFWERRERVANAAISSSIRRAANLSGHLSGDHHWPLLGDRRGKPELLATAPDQLWSWDINEEAVQEYEEALALFDSLGDRVRFLETCVQLWSIHVWAGQFREANALADRAAPFSMDASAPIRCITLAMRALDSSVAGAADRAVELLEELHRIPEGELTPGLIALASACEMHVRHFTGQHYLCEAAARKGTRIFEETGDLWWQAWQADMQLGLAFVPLFCGRPAEAEKLLLKVVPSATKVGHDNMKAQPMARYWYADMLTKRGDAGDVNTARGENHPLFC